MKRKLVYAGGSLTAGMFLASVFSPDMQIPAMLLVLLVSAFFFCSTGKRFVYFAVSGIFFISGILGFTLTDRLVYDRIRACAGQEIFFEGRITDLRDYADEKSGYRIHGKINSDLNADIFYFGDTLECDYQDKISFRCVPSEFENNFLFKTKDYYESSGCFIQTSEITDVQIRKNSRPSLNKLVFRYKGYIEKKISYILPGEYGSFITAMLTGDKSGMNESSKKELYRSGTGHMMAVSGMHLVLIITLLTELLEKAGLTGVKRFFITEIAVILFVVFSGMSVSVIRAAFMMTMICSAGLFNRKNDPLNSLCTASALMLLFSPYLIKNASFLLSVSGTYGAAVLAPYITAEINDDKFSGRMKKRVISVFIISVCVFPFSVMFFDEISLVSPVSDIILIPLCTFALMCGFGTALTGAADVIAFPLLMAGGLASKLVFRISEILSDSGFSTLSLNRSYVPVLTLFLAVFVLFTTYRYKKRSHTLAAMVISAFVLMMSSSVYGYMSRAVLSVYHVGNSKASAVVVSMGKCTDIIDLSGSQKSSQYAAKLIDISGMNNIESVSFMKDPYQSMAAFSERLKLSKVSHVYVPEGTYTAYGTGICGCIPETFGSDGIRLERKGYTVESSDTGEIIIDYNGNKIKCSLSGVETPEGYFTDQNIAVKSSEGGKVKVYKLD